MSCEIALLVLRRLTAGFAGNAPGQPLYGGIKSWLSSLGFSLASSQAQWRVS